MLRDIIDRKMYAVIAYCTILTILSCLVDGKVFVQSYAALGDSYPAGDGVGSIRPLPNLDAICGRFSGAYPVLVSNSPKLNIQPFEFHNVACGGATTKTVTLKQLSYVEGVDVATIQVGGNEVDFFLVLNECIQQWKPLSTCDREIDHARTMIQSTAFIENFHNMVSKARQQIGDRGLLLVLGYARFFNASTDQCNRASFSKTNPANVLSNELRQSVNQLVEFFNDVVRSSAEAKGAVYVDVDEIFEGHRFCEEGVEEPRPDWKGTWFFREKSAQKAMSRIESRSQAGSSEDQKRISLPNPFDGLGDVTRTFHPTEQGHIAIAEKILETIIQLRTN